MLAAPVIAATLLPNVAKAEIQYAPLDQAENKQTDPFYQQARADMEGSLGRLGEDFYATYRIVERIARANDLDERPWRIRISTNDEVNAYASNLNMLTFEGGLLEQLHGDTAALACVVGHEMAHHTENHIPTMVEAETKVEALQEEALEEARAEVENAQRQGQIVNSVIGVFTGSVGRAVSRDSYTGGVIAGPVANRVLTGMSQDQVNQATVRAEEIYNERVEELNQEYSGVLHQQESEADAVGYAYMVRAGFSPEGCIRTMDLLSRTEHSLLPSFSHPNPQDRIAALNVLNTSAGNQSLVSQGNANLSRSPNPLEYGVGRDGRSLRVESRFGTQDIDDSFPQ
ncbi:MAG: M48 family metallopeptidase [Cyanobacteria bacterium J06643_4]